MNFKNLSSYLIGHPCSDQVEQVFQQAGIVFSIKIRQGALLPYWCVWVLQTKTFYKNKNILNVFLRVFLSLLWYCD